MHVNRSHCVLQENKTLEKEIERLNESLRNLQDSKSVLENEICIYENIQKNVSEIHE